MNELGNLIKEVKETGIEGKDFQNLSEKELNTPIGLKAEKIEPIQEGKKDFSINNKEELNKPLYENNDINKNELTPDQKNDIKEKTGWSDNIIDHIKSEEEAAVYMEANLKENNGNLERTDIDWNAKVPQDRIDRMRSLFGDEVADRWANKTNLDLIKEGKAPYGPDGERVNLHHIGQKSDSPLAELTNTEHKYYDGILHDKTKSSEIERPVFRAERQEYWKARHESLQKQDL